MPGLQAAATIHKRPSCSPGALHHQMLQEGPPSPTVPDHYSPIFRTGPPRRAPSSQGG